MSSLAALTGIRNGFPMIGTFLNSISTSRSPARSTVNSSFKDSLPST